MAPRVGKQRRTTRRTTTEESGGGSAFGRAAASRLNKKVGENTAVDLDSDEFALASVKEFISTQCYGLNWAMHLPGVPVGRVICIRGDFMSGKSTIAQHLMAETQKMGGFACYIDTEYAFDRKRAEAIGIECTEDKWLLIQVDTVEKAVSSMRELIETAKEMQDNGNERLVTIVWDSVGATGTDAELKEEFGSSRPGLHARLLSAALRQLTPQIAKYRICLVLVNQEKERVDFFSMGKDTKTMMAEKPIMFHSSVVLRPQHKQKLTNTKKEPTGIRVITTVSKNKLAAPFSKSEFIMWFGPPVTEITGIDNGASILGIAEQQGLVKKSGSWYTYEGQKFYERDFEEKILSKHPEIMEELEAIRTQDARRKPQPEEDEDDEALPVDVSDEEEDADDDSD